jgi:hypothetical protein
MKDLTKEEKEILKEIYIGQNIRPEGIRKKHFNQEQLLTIEKLITPHKLVEEGNFYGTNVIKTTEKGESLGKEIIQEIINKTKELLLKELKNIPEPVLEFLFFDYPQPIYDISGERNHFSSWKEILINTEKINENLNKLSGILYKCNLEVKTHYYVSTRGGETRNLHIIFPGELKDFLVKSDLIDHGLSEDVKERIKLFYLLFKIKEILNIDDYDTRRRNYWTMLQEMKIDETQIKQIIDKFKRKEITTEYKLVTDENFLFQIKDIQKYDEFLKKSVDDYLTSVFERKIKPITKQKIQKAKFEKNSLLNNHAKTFVVLGDFELRIRNFILNRMREGDEENKEWYEKLKKIKSSNRDISLLGILKRRESEDKKNRILPEEELLFYADITHYKDIILTFWEPYFKTDFDNAGMSKEKFEHEMIEINKTRRKVMHLRELTDDNLKTLRLCFIPDITNILD